jgi:hypothetical protein
MAPEWKFTEPEELVHDAFLAVMDGAVRCVGARIDTEGYSRWACKDFNSELDNMGSLLDGMESGVDTDPVCRQTR